MKVKDMGLAGLKLMEDFKTEDSRGSFTKVYNKTELMEHGIDLNFKESYYSISKKDVIRGMHFQTPPFVYGKIVHVVQGSVVDVLLDLRKSSNTYGKCESILLDEKSPKAVYIPSGFAHGFKALEDNTIMIYYVTEEYHKDYDFGLLWNSIPFDWDIKNPIISQRDAAMCRLEDFKSPFV